MSGHAGRFAGRPPARRHAPPRALLYRLGRNQPDQRRVILFLVTRDGSLVRDYYTCDLRGGRPGIPRQPGRTHHVASGFPAHFSVCRIPEHDPGRVSRSARARPRGHYGLLAEYDTRARKMRVLSPFPICGGCHVSPAPDGKKVALDEINPDSISILMFDYAAGKMTRLCRQDYRAPLEKVAGSRPIKQYDINPHPVFDPGSRRIVFNACPDRRVGIYACEVGGF